MKKTGRDLLEAILPEVSGRLLRRAYSAQWRLAIGVEALSRRRGRAVVQIVQLEFSPAQMREVNPDVRVYNLNSTRTFLEAHGFAVFWIGPNFVPISHGAWTDRYLELAQRKTEALLGPGMAGRSMATDLLAVREDYPLLPKLRRLLGSCAPARRKSTLIR